MTGSQEEKFRATAKRIDVTALTEDQGLFRMSFGFDIGPLAASIDRIGLLNRPLIRHEEDRYHVVAGYRRVLAARELGFGSIHCDVLPASMTRATCLELNLSDNLATRQFNHVEKAMACNRLSALFTDREVIDCFMPSMGLPRHEKTLGLYVAMDRELDHETRLELATGRMSLKTAEAFIKLSGPDRAAFRDLFSKIKFNNNQQLQIIDMINDIASRDGSRPALMLRRGKLLEVAEDAGMNQPQKARAYLNRCRRMRYPVLYEAENRFKARVARLGLPRSVNVLDPGSFEEPGFIMQVGFKDGAGLRKIVDQLKDMPLETLNPPWKESVDVPD